MTKGRVGGFKEWNENETGVSDGRVRKSKRADSAEVPKTRTPITHKKYERDAQINIPGKQQKPRGQHRK